MTDQHPSARGQQGDPSTGPGHETSYEIARTIDNPSSSKALAERIWRDLADGKLSLEDRGIWLTAVAQRVVKFVLEAEDNNNSGEQALMALYLAGRALAHHEAREDLEAFDAFTALDGAGPASRRAAARMLRDRGHLKDRTEDEAMKVVDRLRSQRT